MSDTATIDEATTEEATESAAEDTAAAPVTHRRVLGVGLPVPARRRLLEYDEVELVDDAADSFDAAVVSSRLPAARWGVVSELAAVAPVVVLVHPGGEQTAVAMLEAGARTTVAEGNESAIIRFLDDGVSDDLVEGWRAAQEGGEDLRSMVAPSGLKNARAFERRLAEISEEGRLPRLGFVSLGGLDRGGITAAQSIRRRLGYLLGSLVDARGGELFDLEDDGFAFLVPRLDLSSSRRLAAEIVAAASLFRPDGDPLDVAVGMAGPETASDIETLRALASRAKVRAAASGVGVADADELAHSSATELELAVVLAAADAVDAKDPTGEHHRRVAELAVRIAETLGLEADEVAKVGLAARVHDLGKLGFGEAAFDSSHEDHERCVAEHAEIGAAMVRHAAGEDVAAAIRGHHEHFDGTGGPDGLEGGDIPLAARILAVADRWDRVAGSDGAAAVAETLGEEAGSVLDPTIVEVASGLV